MAAPLIKTGPYGVLRLFPLHDVLLPEVQKIHVNLVWPLRRKMGPFRVFCYSRISSTRPVPSSNFKKEIYHWVCFPMVSPAWSFQKPSNSYNVTWFFERTKRSPMDCSLAPCFFQTSLWAGIFQCVLSKQTSIILIQLFPKLSTFCSIYFSSCCCYAKHTWLLQRKCVRLKCSTDPILSLHDMRLPEFLHGPLK